MQHLIDPNYDPYYEQYAARMRMAGFTQEEITELYENSRRIAKQSVLSCDAVLAGEMQKIMTHAMESITRFADKLRESMPELYAEHNGSYAQSDSMTNRHARRSAKHKHKKVRE